MNWQDKGIIISSSKFGENSSIIGILTHNNGYYKGLVKSSTSKTNRGIYQIGNYVDVSWNARLSEHLGMFSAESIYPYIGNILFDKDKLKTSSSICSLLRIILAEREPCTNIFLGLKNLFDSMIHGNWYIEYIKFEIELLSYIGFGLDLTECAATGTKEDLFYISPRTGRAVSYQAGQPYKSKLIECPEFLFKDRFDNIAMTDINKALDITGYFLKKYFKESYNKDLPINRYLMKKNITNE